MTAALPSPPQFHIHRGSDEVEARSDTVRKRRQPAGDAGGVSVRIAPMLATAGDVTSLGDGWAFEFKFDGQRALATVDGWEVRLSSRNGSLISRTYPEIVEGLRAVLAGRSVVLDGEVVALGADGRPSFGLLQRRMQAMRPSAALRREVPAAFFIFDALAVGGESVTQRPYVERRALLKDLGISGGRLAVPPAFTTADGVDGAAMVEMSRLNGMEGVVGKRLTSRFRPGDRSPDWIKQPLRVAATVIVCGWIGTDSHLEALLLAAPHPRGELRYIGHVGTGFTMATRRDLLDDLLQLEQPGSPLSAAPPAWAGGARWVRPTLVGEVHYREFTGRLRHPSWRGIRPDMGPRDAHWPT